jgi:hypothetical protein
VPAALLFFTTATMERIKAISLLRKKILGLFKKMNDSNQTTDNALVYSSRLSGIKKKERKGTSGKVVYYKTTLALIGVVSGAFAFIGALILKDALQSSINGVTSKFKVWWLRTLIYTLLGLGVAISGTILVETMRSKTQAEQEDHENYVKYRDQRKKMCDQMLLEMKKETKMDTLQAILKDGATCYNNQKMSAHVAEVEKQQKACDERLELLKQQTTVEEMQTIVEQTTECYNKEAIKTWFETEKGKRTAAEETLRTMKTDKTSKVEELQKLTEGKEAHNKAEVDAYLEERQQKENDCDGIFEQLKGEETIEKMGEILNAESTAKCYNIEAIKTWLDTETKNRKAADDLYSKVTTDKTSKVEDLRKLYEGKEDVYNYATAIEYLNTRAAKESQCDANLTLMKSKKESIDKSDNEDQKKALRTEMSDILNAEATAECYNKQNMKNLFDSAAVALDSEKAAATLLTQYGRRYRRL